MRRYEKSLRVALRSVDVLFLWKPLPPHTMRPGPKQMVEWDAGLLCRDIKLGGVLLRSMYKYKYSSCSPTCIYQ